jgi:hypothetical protein
MDEMNAAPAPTAQVQVGGKSLAVEEAARIVRGSANWFWWVAGLSLANSIATMTDAGYGMVLGLGITQMVDALFYYDFDGVFAPPSAGGRAFHAVAVLALAGLFVGFGALARRYVLWAFGAGMAVYAADALLFVLAGDWVGVGFHAFVLFMLWGGFGTLRAMRAQGVVPVAAA